MTNIALTKRIPRMMVVRWKTVENVLYFKHLQFWERYYHQINVNFILSQNYSGPYEITKNKLNRIYFVSLFYQYLKQAIIGTNFCYYK